MSQPPQATIDLATYQWLAGESAARLLAEAAQDTRPLHHVVRDLRRSYSAERVHAVLEQVELRRRAEVKFPFAGDLLWTRIGLEQATDWRLAVYKASRFPPALRFDLCCGLGGDLWALAESACCVGVERDSTTAFLAEVNGARRTPERAEIRVEDVEQLALPNHACWHIDPDRRADGDRTTRLEASSPGVETLERLRRSSPDAAFKLAPAAAVPAAWLAEVEREWITTRGECRQQVVWSGALARQPGRHVATILGPAPGDCCRLAGWPHTDAPTASQCARYVYDVDPAVLASGLAAELAVQTGLALLGAGDGYLTGDELRKHPGLAGFEVQEILPFDVKRLKRALRLRGIGRLELKQRGTGQSLEQLRAQLRVPGENSGTVILARLARQSIAIVAQRPKSARVEDR